jgi:hypothetical protein
MKTGWAALLVIPLLLAAAEPPAPVPIREFDIATLSRLGREIYQQDQLAWQATDVVMVQIGLQRLQKDGGRGWVVDTSAPEKPLVRFLRVGADGWESLCDVAFAAAKEPELVVPSNRALTRSQLLHAIALETAKRSFAERKLAWCGGNPNTVVLDDPDGAGCLVYFLRAKPSATQVPIGGHYRMTVSQDGRTVEKIDRLFATCLTLDGKTPDGGKPEMLFMSHVISPTPLETHVFLSLQEKLPFAVAANGFLWEIRDGEIKNQGKLEDLEKQQPSKREPSSK